MTLTQKIVRVTAPNGDVYEAVKAENTALWDISYPEGSDRFWGTEKSLLYHINNLIQYGRDARIAP